MPKSLFQWKAYYVRQCHSFAKTAISFHLQNLKHEKERILLRQAFLRGFNWKRR